MTVPQLGLMEFVTLVEWLVEDGAFVEAGDAIASIETDKVTAELEAPARGTLRIAIPASAEQIPADSVLGLIDDTDQA